eukprot:12889864-Prorocentrum_lima.AAC.1
MLHQVEVVDVGYHGNLNHRPTRLIGTRSGTTASGGVEGPVNIRQQWRHSNVEHTARQRISLVDSRRGGKHMRRAGVVPPHLWGRFRVPTRRRRCQ